jgi:hypothetical protein
MALIAIRFEYITGIRRSFLPNARLIGSWGRERSPIHPVDRRRHATVSSQ